MSRHVKVFMLFSLVFISMYSWSARSGTKFYGREKFFFQAMFYLVLQKHHKHKTQITERESEIFLLHSLLKNEIKPQADNQHSITSEFKFA